MAMLVKSMVVVLVVVLGVMEGARAASLCKMSEDDLMKCKPAVTSPDPAAPTPECCQVLAGADLACLCSYRNSFMLPALGIDPDLAMALPQKCNLATPPGCA